MTKYPELEYLARCYFHQDWKLDDGAPGSTLEVYLAQESVETLQGAAEEIDSIAGAGLTDSEIGSVWLGFGGVEFDPKRHGTGYGEWLGFVREMIRARLAG